MEIAVCWHRYEKEVRGQVIHIGQLRFHLDSPSSAYSEIPSCLIGCIIIAICQMHIAHWYRVVRTLMRHLNNHLVNNRRPYG